MRSMFSGKFRRIPAITDIHQSALGFAHSSIACSDDPVDDLCRKAA